MSIKSNLRATSSGTDTDVSAEPSVSIFRVDDVQKIPTFREAPASGPEMSVTTYKQTRRRIPEDTNIISTARTISNLPTFPLSIVKKTGYEKSEDLEVILKVSARKAHIPRVKKRWDADKR
jgi:hypothetical protein